MARRSPKPRPAPRRKEWDEQVEGALDFLERLKKLPHAGHDDWSAGMRKHYLKRLDVLLGFPPRNAQTRVKLYRVRLAKV